MKSRYIIREVNMKPSGYVIYRGPSLIDSKPIVAIAITNSKNTKTGNMIQTYILVDNQTLPVQNYQSLADYSICGDCKHRRGLDRKSTRLNSSHT